MKLTPGQFCEMLDLTKDTYRHWKQALHPLTGRNGYRPCFTTGDLLAAAFVKAFVETAGLKVGALQPVAEKLFRICNETPWASLERASLVFEPANAHVEVAPETRSHRTEGVTILLACRPILAHLRTRLLNAQELDLQSPLRFPLSVVAGKRARARSGQP